jgi:hypothetical protein
MLAGKDIAHRTPSVENVTVTYRPGRLEPGADETSSRQPAVLTADSQVFADSGRNRTALMFSRITPTFSRIGHLSVVRILASDATRNSSTPISHIMSGSKLVIRMFCE